MGASHARDALLAVCSSASGGLLGVLVLCVGTSNESLVVPVVHLPANTADGSQSQACETMSMKTKPTDNEVCIQAK